MTKGTRAQLTKLQAEALRTIADAQVGTRSAYGMQLSLGTLSQLEQKGMVRSTRGLGSIAMPHTAIKWALTETGRQALEEE